MVELSSAIKSEAGKVICQYYQQKGKEWCYETMLEELLSVTCLDGTDRDNEIVYCSSVTLRTRFRGKQWLQSEPHVLAILLDVRQRVITGQEVFDVDALENRKSRHVLPHCLGADAATKLDEYLDCLLCPPSTLATAEHRDRFGIYGLFRDPRNRFPSKIGETKRSFRKRIPEHIWWGSKPLLVTLIPDARFPALRDTLQRVAWQDVLIGLFPGVVKG